MTATAAEARREPAIVEELESVEKTALRCEALISAARQSTPSQRPDG
jgi:hypothetical protein